MSAAHNDRLIRRAFDKAKGAWRKDSEDILDDFLRELGSDYVQLATCTGDRDGHPTVLVVTDSDLFAVSDQQLNRYAIADIESTKVKRIPGGNYWIVAYRPSGAYNHDVDFKFRDQSEIEELQGHMYVAIRDRT